MGNGFRSILAGLFSLPLFFSPAAFAHGDLCKNPRAAPQLAFSLISYRAGSMDEHCAQAVQGALNHGFTAVTFVPAHIFDGRQVVADGTIDDAELGRCLEYAYQAGLNIIYQPHLETRSVIDPRYPSQWRAKFAVAPDAHYEALMFSGFFSWLALRQQDLRKNDRQVDLVISAELDTSNTQFGAQWAALVKDLRVRLGALKLSGRVAIGYNPNWWPAGHLDDNPDLCAGLRAFVGGVDFVAPSFYGDWSHTDVITADGHRGPRGRAQVDELKNQLMERMTHYESDHCVVGPAKSRRFSIGEFAVGGDLEHAERAEWDMMQAADYPAKRRAVYANLLDWAYHWRAGSAHGVNLGRNWLPTINLWTMGAFDPVGVTAQGSKRVDPEISKAFNAYRKWLCR